MALMKPPKPVVAQKQMTEQRTDMSQSLGLELKISQQLETLTSSMHNLHTKLFGDLSSENIQGRLPRLEHATNDHDQRIEKLERAQIKYAAYASAISFAVSAAAWAFVHIILHV